MLQILTPSRLVQATMRIYRSINWHESAAAPPYVSKIFHKGFLYLCPPFVSSLIEAMPDYVIFTVTEVDVTAANKGKENRKYHPVWLYSVIKRLYAPDDCIVIIRCTENFDHPVLQRVVLEQDSHVYYTSCTSGYRCMYVFKPKIYIEISFVYVGIH